MRKNCSSDREKLLNFEAEGREFSKIWRSEKRIALSEKKPPLVISKILGLHPRIFKGFSRSLEQFFLTVGRNNFGNKIPFMTKPVQNLFIYSSL